MAKATGLGKGLGALLKENESAAQEVIISTIGLNSNQAKRSNNIPSCIDIDDNGGLWINPEYLIPNPKQPRQEFNQKQLEELSDSIKTNGVLEPIIIEQANEKEFFIIAGERRTRAAKMAGLKKVPVQLRKFDDQQKLEMALIENIQREDLNPIDEANAYYNLIQMSDLSQDELAKRVGKNRSTIANSIRLLKLPEDIQKALISGQLTSGHARALLMVKNDSDMRVLYAKILSQGLSVRQCEALAEELNNGSRASAPAKSKLKQRKDPDVALFEQSLRNTFGVKGVNLKGNMDKGTLEITYTNRRDFDRIYELLQSLGENS